MKVKSTWTSYIGSKFVLYAFANYDDESNDDLSFLEK